VSFNCGDGVSAPNGAEANSQWRESLEQQELKNESPERAKVWHGFALSGLRSLAIQDQGLTPLAISFRPSGATGESMVLIM
jgi:hypothetical protein